LNNGLTHAAVVKLLIKGVIDEKIINQIKKVSIMNSNTVIVSYSHTGNNATLAEGLAKNFNLNCMYIKELRKRTVMTIVLDVLFNRTPNIEKSIGEIENYENIVFVAPIWLGKVASPLRPVFKMLKGKSKNFSFVSISAGPEDNCQRINTELGKRLGNKPEKVLNPLIVNLMTDKTNPSRKELDEYKLKGDDAKMVINEVVKEFSK